MSLFLLGHASTPDKIKLITSAAGKIDTHASWIDYTDADPPVVVDMNNESQSIVTAATTDILAGVASATQRRVVKQIAIVNAHASVSNSITVLLDDIDGTDYQIAEAVTLAPGEAFKYEEGIGWFKSAAAIPVLPSGDGRTTQIASHSADTYYLGFPVTHAGITRLRAGAFFRWTFGVTKGAAGTAAPTFNIRFGTAGTTGDTSRALMTMAAQTAAADTGYIEVEAAFRSVGGSAVIVGRVHLHHHLATTGLNVTTTGNQLVQTVGASFDSTVNNSIIGLSVNPGASGAWVVESVVVDAVGLVF